MELTLLSLQADSPLGNTRKNEMAGEVNIRQEGVCMVRYPPRIMKIQYNPLLLGKYSVISILCNVQTICMCSVV